MNEIYDITGTQGDQFNDQDADNEDERINSTEEVIEEVEEGEEDDDDGSSPEISRR